MGQGVFDRRVLPTLSVVVIIGLLAVACGSGPPAVPSASSSGNKPTVVVLSPVSGAVLQVGVNAPISGSASDSVGVDHVALFADGVSVASTPASQPAPLVPFSLNWLATPPGPHTLQVIAYRADGTSSDPAVIQVVVGAASGSGLLPGGSLPPLGTLPTLPPPPPGPTKTKKPKTPPPSVADTPTANPTATETPTAPAPTPTATPLPTAASDGTAPDDSASDPHFIDIEPTTTNCPPQAGALPIAAVGCIWEQISAPAGDSTDALDFKPLANTSYQMWMTSCSDVSGQTAWGVVGDTGDPLTGCDNWLIETTSATPPATTTIVVTFKAAPVQLYNLYQFTVYQCQFANCGNQ